ncbi:hypothetical protein FG386_003289 [Cryptosporidium ryanae]|uniref:uncharacterized protein n=1 Tax=Cryptosporidium ryanae TaxID=515981 RepID=UPI00351A8BA7|nr:hypothetical protein FG386_003289 [Cryptosporidium ryanae]
MFSIEIEHEYFVLWRIQKSNLSKIWPLIATALLTLFIVLDNGCIAVYVDKINETDLFVNNGHSSSANCSSVGSGGFIDDGDDDILIKLLLGKERFELAKQTFRNELKLYNNLNAFPKRSNEVDSYIQLYTICSYFSPILLCDIYQDPNIKAKAKTPSLLSNGDPVSAKTHSGVNLQVNSFPWVNGDDGFAWSVQSGSYGNVVCGEFIGGDKRFFPRSNFNVNSFFLNTYKLLSSELELHAFVPYFGNRIEYRKLNTCQKYAVCVKVFRSSFNKEYFKIWERENFNLKWLERETWIYGNHGNKNGVYLNFTPKQVYLSFHKKTKRFKGDVISNKKASNEHSSHSLNYFQNHSEYQMFIPNVFEANYPWSIYGKYWSSFLLMERFWGPSITDISNYLLRKDVVDWTKLSTVNEYIWSVSIVKLVYLFLQTIILFTFSGKFIYQHCDLHANNVIFLSKNWESKNYENNFFVPSSDEAKTESASERLDVKEKIITEIVRSDIEKMRIIDLTFVTSYNRKSRREVNFCYTYNEISISDLDNWTIFTYELSFRIDKILETDPVLRSRVNPLGILTRKLEANKSFERLRPKFKGGSKLWWENWELNNKVTFDDKYESIANFDSYFSKTVDDLYFNLVQKNQVLSIDSSLTDTRKYFKNPASLLVYMRNVFYVPHKILSFVHCLVKFYMQKNGKAKTHFQLSSEGLVNYFASELTSFEGLPPNWLILESKHMYSYFKKCKSSKEDLFGSPLHFQEPCLDKYCLIQKSFPKYIQDWAIDSENDDKHFTKISRKIIKHTTSGIHFSLAILLIYQYEREVMAFVNEKSEQNGSVKIQVDTSSLKSFLSSIEELSSPYNVESENSKFLFDKFISASGVLQSLYLDQKLSELSCVRALGESNIMGNIDTELLLELEGNVCSRILGFVYSAL